MNLKTFKSLVIFVAVIGPIMFTCLFLIITGTVTIFLSGFAVDTDNRLYLGKDSRIEVFDNGILDHTISPKTSRGYIFTIQSDNTILVSTGSIVYNLDIDGNVILQEEDFRSRVYYAIKKNGNPYYANNGEKYVLKYPWGRTEIIHEGNDQTEIIYQMPVLDYVTEILLVISIISLFIFIPRLILKIRNIKI